MEPPLTVPRCIASQREADALFSEATHFTPANTFTAKIATGATIMYSVHTTPPEATSVDHEVRVLLLAGLMNGKEAFAPIIDLLLDKWAALDDTKPTRKLVLVAFDHRGCGGSSTSWRYVSTHTLAMDALALMDTLGWATAHIVGPSLGGMIAQEFALAQPDRVSSLSLMLTSRGRFNMKGATAFILSMATARDDQTVVQRSLDFFYPSEILLRPLHDSSETVGDVLRRFHLERMKDVASQRATTFVGQVLAVKTHFVSDERLARLRDAAFPIMIMGCADDDMIPGDESIKLWRAIGHARLVYYDRAGHCVMVQCPDQVTQEILTTIQAGR